MTFAVTLSDPATTEVDVPYVVDSGGPGAATSGIDFRPKTGVLRFKPAALTGLSTTTRFINVSVLPDSVPEGDETVRVTLLSASGGFLVGQASALGTIAVGAWMNRMASDCGSFSNTSMACR